MTAPRMSRISRLGIALFMLVALTACTGGTDRNSNGYVGVDGSSNDLITIVPVADRKEAPVLKGEDLDGTPLSTATFAGKTIVVNLWGWWCAPCRAEAPVLKKISAEYAAKDVQFVGIVNRSKPTTALAFNRKQGITYPSFADQGGKLELEFVDSLPTMAVPTTWVIDAKGRVAARIMDPKLSASTLSGVIDEVQKSVL